MDWLLVCDLRRLGHAGPLGGPGGGIELNHGKPSGSFILLMGYAMICPYLNLIGMM